MKTVGNAHLSSAAITALVLWVLRAYSARKLSTGVKRSHVKTAAPAPTEILDLFAPASQATQVPIVK